MDFDHTLPTRNHIPRGLDPTDSISRGDPHAKSTAPDDPPVNSQVDDTDGGPRGADNRRPRPARHSALPLRTRMRTDLDGIVGPLCSTNLRRRNGATHLFPIPRPLTGRFRGGGGCWSVSFSVFDTETMPRSVGAFCTASPSNALRRDFSAPCIFYITSSRSSTPRTFAPAPPAYAPAPPPAPFI